MILLSPLFLLFGLAAAVPLVLHLYQRRRRQVMLYSSNRFFTQSIVHSQRRMRLRRFLLLLLRMAACILLALAVSQPILHVLGLGASAGNRDVVILLDDSLSMQASGGPRVEDQGPRDDPSSTRFVRAQQLALEALQDLGGGDQAAVVTFTGRQFGMVTRDGVKLAGDTVRLIDQIRQLRPTSAAGDAGAALRTAASLFDSTRQRARLLLVLSDGQASDWPPTGSGGSGTTWPQPPQPIDALWLKLAPPTDDNLAIESMGLAQGTAVVGQPNLLTVRLVNYRPATAKANLIVRIDDREQVRRPIDLPARSPIVEHVPLVFDSPGQHRLIATLEAASGSNSGGDALPQDNTLYECVQVIHDLPVLLIDGEGPSRKQSAAFFLRPAMLAVGSDASEISSPPPSGEVGRGAGTPVAPNLALLPTSPDGGGEKNNSLRVEMIQPAELVAATLSNYRVVVLSNVKDLPLDQLERLERFVMEGGGLAIVLGDRCDPQFYNQVLGAASRPLGGLMPVEIAGPVGSQEAGVLGQPMHLLRAEWIILYWRTFKGTLRGALSGIDVYKTFQIKPGDPRNPGSTWVVAAMDNDLPLLIERGYGAGKVMMLATAPTPSWTNLPLRRVFIPLVNRIVTYLAGGGSRTRPADVGREVVVLRGGWDTSQVIHVRTPSGRSLAATARLAGAEPLAVLSSEQVAEAGFYEVVDAGSRGQASQNRSFVAVNVPRSESLPAALDPDAVQKSALAWKIRTVTPGDPDRPGDAGNASLARLLGSQQVNRGVWDALLWAVLALVIVEPLIANRLIGGRKDATK